MVIKEETDKAKWNALVRAHAPRSGAFLQSWEWGVFQEADGKTVHRVETDGGTGLFIGMPLPLGKTYLYCPRGPVGNGIDLREVADANGVPFVRFEPSGDGFVPIGTKPSRPVQPPDTLILDLTQDEDALLAAMHHKTRYNIRLAEKKGVTVDIPASGVGMEEVWKVFETTGARGGFRLHARGYYERMLGALKGGECQAFLATASFEGTVIAANLMIDFAGTRTYLHGASANAHREVMAPYLLHWALIRDAKAKGMRAYDWWGVAPEGAKDHPWAGVTRFKLGWGGERVSYPGTFDLVRNPFFYYPYAAVRELARRLHS